MLWARRSLAKNYTVCCPWLSHLALGHNVSERVHSMPDDRLPAAVTDGECCDLARKIRELASQTRLMFAQRELLLLAAKFERRGDYPDQEERRGSHPIFGSFP